MCVMLFLDTDLWHTREEIEAARRAEKNAAENAPQDAANLALQRARLLLPDVVRMPDGDCTIHGPEQDPAAGAGCSRRRATCTGRG